MKLLLTFELYIDHKSGNQVNQMLLKLHEDSLKSEL